MLVRGTHRPAAQEHCAIAVMAKASHPGRTKTRLSPPLSLTQAAELNTAFLCDIADNLSLAAQRADIDCFMAFGPPGSAAFFEHHLPAHVGLLEAWLPNFGDCLFHTVRSLLDCGYGAACVLNSDSPTLPTEVLVQAAQSLRLPGDRLVAGPCTDGGYYLLGMKRPHRRLFEEVAWSTGQVFAQTRSRAAELRLDCALLTPWYDVDDAASLAVLTGELLSRRRFSADHASYDAMHTTAVLRRQAVDGAPARDAVLDADPPSAALSPPA